MCRMYLVSKSVDRRQGMEEFIFFLGNAAIIYCYSYCFSSKLKKNPKPTTELCRLCDSCLYDPLLAEQFSKCYQREAFMVKVYWKKICKYLGAKIAKEKRH